MIEDYSEGHIRIDGADYEQDVKIIGSDVVPNWWRKSGHRIEVEDIGDILDANPDILVVGTGYAENVKISEQVLSLTKGRNIRLIPEATPRAVRTYNGLLSEGNSVAGAFHLTC